MRTWLYRLLGLCAIATVGAGYALYSTSPQPLLLTDDERGTLYTQSTRTTSGSGTYTTSNDPKGLQKLTSQWDSFVHTYTGTAPEPKVTPQPSRGSAVAPHYDPPTQDQGTPLTSTPSYTPPELSLPKAEPDDALRAYGNTTGAAIQSAVATMGDQNKILMAFVSEESQKQGILTLAAQYDALARHIENEEHPTGFGTAAHELAHGYTQVADGLRSLAAADRASIYTQLLAYNTQVEHFADAFVSYASLFGAYGIRFTSAEPGGIFTPVTSSL